MTPAGLSQNCHWWILIRIRRAGTQARPYTHLYMISIFIRKADDTEGIQALQAELLADEVADGLPHYQPFGFSSVPMDGAEGVAVPIGGDRSHLAVLVVSDRRYRPTDEAPGTVVVHGVAGQKITLTPDGKTRIEGSEIEIHATNRLAIDCGGNGTVITPTTRSYYVDGSVSTTNPLHPPEVP